MKFKEQIGAVLLAAVLSLEAWQLYELSSLRADVSRIEQKLDDHIQFHSAARLQAGGD